MTTNADVLKLIKDEDAAYVENKRTQFKLKHVRTADCVVAGFRIHKSGDGVGSLLLGLHADDGRLRSQIFPRRRAAMLTTFAQGLALQARAGASMHTLRAAVDAILDDLSP